MTTEPKFIPKEAAKIQLSEDTSVRVRMIDCVGYMVEGANGHMENGDIQHKNAMRRKNANTPAVSRLS